MNAILIIFLIQYDEFNVSLINRIKYVNNDALLLYVPLFSW